MNYDPPRHHRRSIRLPAYDYARAAAYFVTLVAHTRESLFGQVIDSEMRLSVLGLVVAEEWRRTRDIRGEIQLDAFVAMPNHIHAIVIIADQTVNVGAHGRAPLRRPPRSLGSFIAGFKSAVTKRINEIRGTAGLPVWHRNYYEHVIRNEEELDRIRQYIAGNPTCWDHDRENPDYRPRDDHHVVAEAFQHPVAGASQPRRELPARKTRSWYNPRYNGHDTLSHPGGRRAYAVSRKEAAEEDPQAQVPEDAQEDPLAAQAQIGIISP